MSSAKWRLFCLGLNVLIHPQQQSTSHLHINNVDPDIFSCIFVNEKFCILIKISLNFVAKGPIDKNSALV